MRIKFKGEYLGNYSGVPTVGEARVIKRELNMLPGEFELALDGMDPDAISLLVAIMQARKSGEPIGDHDELDFEFHEFEVEYTDSELADMTKEQLKLVDQIKKQGDKLRAATDDDAKGKGAEPPPAVSA